MKTLNLFFLLMIFLAVLFSVNTYAEIPVTVTNPNNTTPNLSAQYTSLANALTALNSATDMSGPITLTLTGGTSETTPPTGFTIGSATLNPVLNSTNTVTIICSGGTATLNAGVGTKTPSSSTPDGILKIVGADYITIDGLTFTDGNTTNPTTMEFGVALFKLSASDGAQYNTIKNCIFNMQRINNASGSGPMVEGSVGILVINSTPTTATTTLTPSSASGSNSYNKIYANTINCGNYGIAISGFLATGTFYLGDTGNDIGGYSSSTGNTILNFGGGGGSSSAAIRVINQWGINVSYNSINNNNGSGVNHTAALRGIYAESGTSANANINNNTITLKSGATSQLLTAIDNGIGSTASNNTININNNTIQNCTYSSATSAIFTAILNSATALIVNINNNTISGNSIGSLGTANTCTFQGIYNSAILVSQTFSVSYNNISGNSLNNSSGTVYCVRAGNQKVTLNGNNINNISIPNSSGSAAPVLYGYHNIYSQITETYTNNTINNLSISGSNINSAAIIYGIYSNTGKSHIFTISGNIIYNLSYSNSSTGSALVKGIIIDYGTTENIYKNKIYSLSADGTASIAYGLHIVSETTGNIYNNIIGNISTPTANTSMPIAGIYIASGNSTTMNVYYNTVYINASSSGVLFGSTALYTYVNPTLNLINNILVNLSTSAGTTGFTTAFRKSHYLLTNYSTSSNNNLFYAGTPGTNNLIMYDGTNSYQTLLSFKTAVGPTREALSVTENPPFLSTSGSDNTFLHINSSVPTFVESGGTNSLSCSDDFDGNIRYGYSGYSGTGTAPDIGADEFEGIKVAFSGDYTIGISGDYPTLSSALFDLNKLGVTGPTRFLLIDASYTTNETFPLTINITNANAPTSTNTITIKPNTGVTSLIQGASVNAEIFLIMNSYISIDGSNTTEGTSRNLTIENTSASSPRIIGVRSTNPTPNTNFTIKNCTVINGSNGGSSASNIHFSNTDLTSGYFNNITILNNNIQKTYIGIYINGVTAAGNGSGTFISGNDLNTAGANSISATGIHIMGCDGAIVSNNNVGNISSSFDYLVGIQIDAGTKNTIVSGNIISNISTASPNSYATVKGVYAVPGINATNINITNNNISNLSTTVAVSSLSGIFTNGPNINVSGNTISGLSSANSAVAVGINVQNTSTGIMISKNKIFDIKNTNPNGYSAVGITLASISTTANTSVYNNLIYDIAGYGNASQSNSNGYGICIASGGGYNIYYNSINLATNQTLSTGLPSCLIIYSVVNTTNSLDIRNNIFSIPATIGTNRYAVICNTSSNVFSNLNFNDYYTSGANIGLYNSTNYSDLSAWKSATGKDKFSVSADPGFTSATNLIPNPLNPNSWNINGGAYPISNIATDFNNVYRRTSLPGDGNDIGAYEFTPSITPNPASVNTVGNVTTILSASATLATITWTGGTSPTLSALYYPGENPNNVPLGAKYGNSHLDITATGGSNFTYNIIYNFNLAMLGSITNGNFNNARLAKYSAGIWQNFDALPEGTNYTITANTLSGFSTFALCDYNAPLPVQLSSFTSSTNERDVILNWITNSENNNLGFDIERKPYNTLNDWTKIGFIKGNNTSGSTSNYLFKDTKLNSGKYNYRLKQLDYNGNYEYHYLSAIVEITLPLSFHLSQNYPNPFNPTTNIDFALPVDTKVSIILYDITGKQIKSILNQILNPGYHTICLNVSDLSTGIYFYRMVTGNFIQTKKLMIMK